MGCGVIRALRAERVRIAECDLRALAPPREPFRVVANLPFSIVMTVLGRLLDDPRSRLRRADLVVPWNLAVHLSRRHHQARRARRRQRRYGFGIAARLDAQSFRPPPSVAAAVLVVERYGVRRWDATRRQPRPVYLSSWRAITTRWIWLVPS